MEEPAKAQTSSRDWGTLARDYALGLGAALVITLLFPKMAFVIRQSVRHSVLEFMWVANLPSFYTPGRWAGFSIFSLTWMVVALSLLLAPAVGAVIATRTLRKWLVIAGIGFGAAYSLMMVLVVAVVRPSSLEIQAVIGMVVVPLLMAALGVVVWRRLRGIRPA